MSLFWWPVPSIEVALVDARFPNESARPLNGSARCAINISGWFPQGIGPVKSGGGAPRPFVYPGGHLSELSVFADESGDTGDDSRLYLVTLVFHDQRLTLAGQTAAYEALLREAGMRDIPFHMQPLLSGEGDYRGLGIGGRAKMLDRFHAFAVRCPIKHATFCYDKREFADFKSEIAGKMACDITGFIKGRYSYFLEFDQVKIYYDNGQAEVTRSLHESFENALSANVPVFKDNVHYRSFRLCQVADMICSFEYLSRKFDKKTPVEPSKSDLRFFDSAADLRNRYLKKLDRLRFD